MSGVTLVLVDDHAALRQALAVVLNGEPDLSVIGVANCVDDGLDVILRRNPDVALVDLRLAGESGLDLVSALADASAKTRVLIYTGATDPAQLRAACDSGAAGVALKSGDLAALKHAIHAVASTGTHADPELARLLTSWEDPLTAREREIIDLVASGLTAEEIADRLVVSVHTVTTHLRNVRTRLGARNRAHSVALAARLRRE